MTAVAHAQGGSWSFVRKTTKRLWEGVAFNQFKGSQKKVPRDVALPLLTNSSSLSTKSLLDKFAAHGHKVSISTMSRMRSEDTKPGRLVNMHKISPPIRRVVWNGAGGCCAELLHSKEFASDTTQRLLQWSPWPPTASKLPKCARQGKTKNVRV